MIEILLSGAVFPLVVGMILLVRGLSLRGYQPKPLPRARPEPPGYREAELLHHNRQCSCYCGAYLPCSIGMFGKYPFTRSRQQ